jgi:hypothetical protein
MRSPAHARSLTRTVQMMCAALLVAAMAVPAHAATLSQTWAERYVGGTDFQYASSLAMSPDGRTAFVTGISAGPNHEGDPYDVFATIAYDTATGATRWIARYSDADVDNWASMIVISPDGQRLFVTGATPNGYPVVAYDAATGTRLWVSHAAGPGYVGSHGRLAVSPNGLRVYFTGETQIGDGPDSELLTVAFRTATGSAAWSRTVVDPSGQVRPEAIRVDPQGRRLFITGSTGDLNQYPSPTPPDFITVAYRTGSGGQLWVKRYDGTGHGYDQAFAVSVTPNGQRVIVAGTSTGTSGLPQYAVIAYGAVGGETIWVTRDGGSTIRRSVAAMTMDRAGTRVFVTGSESTGDWSANRYRTVAFSVEAGTKVWSKAFNGATVANAHAIAISADGSYVFVTGGADSTAAPYYTHYATVAYRVDTGDKVASARYVGGPNGGAEAEAIGVSPSGGIFVTGRGGGAFATVAYQLI